MMPRPFSGHRYHFTGVGGSGMAPLAALTASMGAAVTGSDRNLDRGLALPVFDDLRRAGVALVPQDGSRIAENLTALVHSTAVEPQNPDFARAETLGIPRIRRGSFLAQIANARRTIAIAGTSGKSTVTAMIAHVLVAAGFDPSFLGGGAAVALAGASAPGSLRVGASDWFVVETDESDGSVAEFAPAISVLTNLSRDHKEIDETARLFESLLAKTRERIVINAGDPVLLRRVRRPENIETIVVEGAEGAEGAATAAAAAARDHAEAPSPSAFRAEHVRLAPDSVSFHIGGAAVLVPFPGALTVQNAILAIAAAAAAGVPAGTAASALATFGGVRRRLECVGSAGGVDVFDDFGHNPVKIAAALAALRPAGALRVYFQPHGYGPTRFFSAELIDTFRRELREGDLLVLAPIYDAGGTADRSMRSEDLVRELRERGVRADLGATREDACRALTRGARAGDRIVVMGARDDTLPAFARSIFAALSAGEPAAAKPQSH